MTLAALAVVLAAGAAALLSPGRPDRRLVGGGQRRWTPPGGWPPLVGWLVLPGCSASLALLVDGRRLVLALIGMGAAAGAVSLAARGRRLKQADARAAKVVEVCEALVGELRAGQPLLTALERCQEVWPDFGIVVSAARLGADVPTALRRAASRPGAGGLVDVAAAWQVSEGSGSGLALAVGQVATSAREAQTTRRLIRSELASAQATARVVAALPLAALTMSAGIGADPWHFLLATPIGLGCLGGGLALAYAGLIWIDRIAMEVLGG